MKVGTSGLIKWGIGMAIGFIAIGGITYIARFGDHEWSEAPESWSQFGDYMSMYVNIASLVLVSFLTYLVFLAQSEAEMARDRPIIVFQTEVDPETKKPHWVIRNATDNVALNVLVTHSEQLDEWKKPVMVYTLGGRQERIMTWFRPAYQIRAVYYDVKGNVLTSTMQSDRMTIEPGVNGLTHFREDEYRRYDEVIRGVG